MQFMSGGYGVASLHSSFAISLWLDLSNVLVWYRTVVDRLGHLKRAARNRRVSVEVVRIENEETVLRARTIHEFGGTAIVVLANSLVHESWHPKGSPRDLNIGLYWKESDSGRRVAFTEDGDVRDSVFDAIVETRVQIWNL